MHKQIEMQYHIFLKHICEKLCYSNRPTERRDPLVEQGWSKSEVDIAGLAQISSKDELKMYSGFNQKNKDVTKEVMWVFLLDLFTVSLQRFGSIVDTQGRMST